jgi:Protein of unknown function (DUF5672)
MTTLSSGSRLALPQVTLCAATSVNVEATFRALEASLGQVDFADCLLFTDSPVQPRHPAIRVVPIQRLVSAQAYSEFLFKHLADHVATSHCLVVQWDGHVLDAGRWDAAFLNHDFIGASWPHFRDGHNVGNGGFSLRSRRLLQMCQSPRFRVAHPEDITIGRTHRAWLESHGLRFASSALADRFSAERAGDPLNSFGYHGVWHMPRVLGMESFWEIYRTLDERSTIRHDVSAMLRQVGEGSGGTGRALQLLSDYLGDAFARGK